MRLNVGSGGKGGPGWVGVDAYCADADVHALMWDLPFADGTVEEIFSSHALEHVAKAQVLPTLREWYRVLRPGGKLILRVPDLAWCCRWWLEHQTTGWDMDILFGNQSRTGEFHQTGFTEAIGRDYLERAGFRVDKVEELQTHSQKTLSFEAVKP